MPFIPPYLPKGGLACFVDVNDEAILAGGTKIPLYVCRECAGLGSVVEVVWVVCHPLTGDLGVQTLANFFFLL